MYYCNCVLSDTVTVAVQSTRPYFGIISNKTDTKGLCSSSIYQGDGAADYWKIKRTVLSYLPKQYDKDYRNFCWNSKLNLQDTPLLHQLINSYSRQLSDVNDRLLKITNPENPSSITCLPSVFMSGFPKSGSTYLYDVLTKHPSVMASREKEPHFWTKFPFQNDAFDSLGLLTYLGNFMSTEQYANDILSIDASQSLIWDTEKCKELCEIPKLFQEIVPKAKFIIVMRDPADRTYSDYWHFTLQCQGVVSQKSKEIVSNRIFYVHLQKEIDRFSECLRKYSLSECLHYIHVTATPVLKGCGILRLGISVYITYIQRWLQYFSRDQFLFLRQEDLASDPYAVLKQVWKFLDLEILSKDVFEKILSETTEEPSSYPSLSTKSRKLLNDFFNPFNKQLSIFLNDTRYLWQ